MVSHRTPEGTRARWSKGLSASPVRRSQWAHRPWLDDPRGRIIRWIGVIAQGLSRDEARRRLALVGPNEVAAHARYVPWRQLAALVTSPLILVLLAASAVSALVGEVLNASVIALMVLLGIALNFAQTYRSHRAAERLRALVAPTATVHRDGEWVERPRAEIVPGDVIRLSAGDLVPADGRLLEERELHVQQAALTGESVPVEKEVTDVPASVPPLERPDLVFAGTSVVSGLATAVVEHTGRDTVFGRIAADLIGSTPETEFDRGSRSFGLLITRTVFVLVLFVLLVNIALRRDPLTSLLFAISLAVGLTPEYLPVIMTVTLGQGAIRMSRQGVIVKNLASIQNLGSMDVLCSDKTNTLTTGVLTLERAVDIEGREAQLPLDLGALNSAFETGIASPLDAAILQRARPEPTRWRKVDEIPFDFVRRRASVVLDGPDGRALVTKGAPEGVFDACTSVGAAGGSAATFDAGARRRAACTYRALSAEGYRVLAVARRTVPLRTAYGPEDERDLTLAGLLAFGDPAIPGVGDVVRALTADGVALKVLSGDNELVSRHVCEGIGIDVGRVVLGSEVDALDDAALGPVAEATRVFARMAPDQKERVLLALRHRGHVVGFLGDGINDAPSLRSADVGISVTDGVDVAKEAAAIIVRERGLEAIHDGILAGRRAFGNVMKYLLMGTSSNFGNMLSMAAASLFLPFLPMLPRQILLNNFLYDLAQVTIPTDNVDASFTRKPRRWDIGMVRTFMLAIGPVSSIYDLLTFGALLFLFHASEATFQAGWFVESLATQTLVLLVIRTAGDPFRSRPSAPLVATTLAVVAVGAALPLAPFASALGFVPLPPVFYAFLAVVVLTYLALVEAVKRRVMRRLA